MSQFIADLVADGPVLEQLPEELDREPSQELRDELGHRLFVK
ncbi:MAG: hypothetical protein QN120_05005 [Armatimonadota bacterium]|nr:hypothetical protein [Armatimonadota bacterium]